jgi:hypothetical protein
MISLSATSCLAYSLRNYRHPGEGRDLDIASNRGGEIPAFAGMTKKYWWAEIGNEP